MISSVGEALQAAILLPGTIWVGLKSFQLVTCFFPLFGSLQKGHFYRIFSSNANIKLECKTMVHVYSIFTFCKFIISNIHKLFENLENTYI